jgi:hypothetical protein
MPTFGLPRRQLGPVTQGVIDLHVECDREGVQICVRETCKVELVLAMPILDAAVVSDADHHPLEVLI